MTVSSKVRIYDLAKELKLDTKRLIEEVRREGVDVSVPSNSVSKELAEKIRNKYFPKKETAVKRAVKVVKRAAMPQVEAAVAAEPEPLVSEPEAAPAPIEEPVEIPVSAEPAAPKPITPARLVKKLTPAVRAEKPVDAAPESVPSPEPPPIPIDASPTSEIVIEEPEIIETAEIKSIPVAVPSRQVRVLRPTAAALNAGIRPGERAPAPAPPPPPVAPRP